MSKEKSRLVWIHKMGRKIHNKYMYIFYFTNDINNCEGDGWETSPIHQYACEPDEKYIDKIIEVEMEEDLSVITDEDENDRFYTFSYYDVHDGIIAIAWENGENYNKIRLIFRYADTLDSVLKQFEIRDIESYRIVK